MNRFAEYLAGILEERDISFRKASTLCDIDRTSFMRYARGERLPADESIVIKIAKGLDVSDRIALQMREIYKICLVYPKDMQEMEKIENFCRETEYHLEMPYYQEDVRVQKGKEFFYNIQGKDSAITCIQKIAEQNDKEIYIFGALETIDILIPLFVKGKVDKKISHIIDMDGNNPEGNIDKFFNIYKLFLYDKNYRVYSHYLWHHKGNSGIKLNYILSGNTVMIFDHHFQNIIYTDKSEYVNYYKKMYEEVEKNCSIYGENDCSGIGKSREEENLQEGNTTTWKHYKNEQGDYVILRKHYVNQEDGKRRFHDIKIIDRYLISVLERYMIEKE